MGRVKYVMVRFGERVESGRRKRSSAYWHEGPQPATSILGPALLTSWVLLVKPGIKICAAFTP